MTFLRMAMLFLKLTYTKWQKMDIPEVSVELQIGEEQTRSRIAHKIGLEYREQDYSTEGIYETTVIFYGNIPPKYLKKL